MKKGLRSKWLIYTAVVVIILVLIIGFISYKQNGKVDYKEVSALILGGFVLFGTVIGVAFSSNSVTKVSDIKKDVDDLKESDSEMRIVMKQFSLDQETMKTAINDIDESFKHKREIVNLCQQIENETSDIFDAYSEINAMLRDYIVGVNFVITDIIERQYSYDFDLFDAKYFKSKLINRVNSLTKEINFAMLNKKCFEKISDKVLTNIRTYITDLKYIKDLENGTRRKRFKELTLNLTKKITDHSIDIYKNHKQAV